MLREMRVLIVDHVGARGRANGVAFASHVANSLLYDGTRWTRGGSMDAVDVPFEHFDLVLLHDNDTEIWNDLQKVGIESNCVLRYTGDTPMQEKNWIVARPISGRDSAINVAEALELVKWTESGSPRAECDLPSLLRNRQESLLPAMAILCQGFLAVYAKDQASVADQSVAEALRAMGWIPEKHAGLVNEELQTVSKCGWWLDTFGLCAVGEVGKQRVPADSWTPFKAEILQEWGSTPFPVCFTALLGKLEHCERIDSASNVAETYLGIATRLGEIRNRGRNLV
jgi:hypothetical protein